MPIRESVKGINKTLDFNRQHGNWLVVQKFKAHWATYIASVSQPMFLDVARHMTKDMPEGSFQIVDKRTKKGLMLAAIGKQLNSQEG